MNARRKFIVPPESTINLDDFDPDFSGKGETKKRALREATRLQKRLGELQFRLYAEGKQSLLIVLQALDTGGKDGVIRHVFEAMNPQSCRVAAFKEPSTEERAHDFLWRIEAQTPRRGEVVVFNRSHYEDVLVVRVHGMVPAKIWQQRYEQINAFEERLAANGTQIVKFYLHISKAEQLERFKDRLDDPARNWKISQADYSERELWNEYRAAYNDAVSKCSTRHAPWFIIPGDRKWYRNLAISRILVETMEKMKIEQPKPSVDLGEIRRLYHEAVVTSTGS